MVFVVSGTHDPENSKVTIGYLFIIINSAIHADGAVSNKT